MILLAWLLADFISGIVHWWEDRALKGVSRFEFINGVRADNDRHHRTPRSLTETSWWENINTTAPFAWVLTAILFAIGAPAVITLAVFFLSFGNLVHRWSHENKRSLPLPVVWAQKIGLFISPSHHAGHHFYMGNVVSREDSSIRFCVMSNWLNPVLDKIRFFNILERIVSWR